MYSVLRPLLFAMDAERAHGASLRSLDALHIGISTQRTSIRPFRLPHPAHVGGDLAMSGGGRIDRFW